MPTAATPSTPTYTFGKSVLAGFLGGIVAAVINVVVFFVGNVSPEVATPMGPPITLGPVILFSLVMVTLGGVVLGLVRGRVRVYQVIALVVMVLSFGAPFGLQDAPGSMIATLEVMHVVAGLVAIFLVPRLAAR